MMPVYDYTYKTYEGPRHGAMARWVTIPRYTYMEFFSQRFFVWLFTVAWLQFVLRLVYIYLRVNTQFVRALLPGSGDPLSWLPPVNPFFFKNMIDVQLIFCFIFTFRMGADLISRDLRHSAVVLYMSKPISRWEYFLGKFLSLFGILMMLTWFQTTLLFVIQYLVSQPNSEWRLYFWKDYAWLPVPIFVYSAIVSAGLALMILAASSLVKNSRYAGMLFAGYIIGTSVVGGILSDFLRNSLAISPFASGVQIGYFLFGLGEGPRAMSQGAAWTGVIGICALCAAVLYWRLRNAARYGR